MPKGPKGQKRPADVISNAVHVMKIATGELPADGEADISPRRAGGLKGGPARAARLTPQERAAIGQKAAQARWAARRRKTSSS